MKSSAINAKETNRMIRLRSCRGVLQRPFLLLRAPHRCLLHRVRVHQSGEATKDRSSAGPVKRQVGFARLGHLGRPHLDRLTAIDRSGSSSAAIYGGPVMFTYLYTVVKAGFTRRSVYAWN